ncbi:MAG: hypothetical protein WDN48_10365 [Pseudolabrys sp.]
MFIQQKVLSGRSYTPSPARPIARANLDLGPWRWFTFGLSMVYLLVVVILPSLALIVAGVPQVHVHPRCRQPVRHEAIFADAFL